MDGGGAGESMIEDSISRATTREKELSTYTCPMRQAISQPNHIIS